ncbi:MAG TPA: sulfatase-like hydrolase/transferase, partial [Terriglobia bacterium]|nr:sulfatase-like hydrolase/transferase [Terriglobia bacterium]
WPGIILTVILLSFGWRNGSPRSWGATAVATAALAAGAPPARPNVIIITIDTLRADHLGCYGDAQVKTPNIDSLARIGVRFSHASSPVPITLPAHTAIFTGSFPMATGMHDFSGNKLAPGSATLARVLASAGYSAAAFIGAAVLDSRFGLNQGFDVYFDHFDFSRLDETNLDLTERRGDVVTGEALDWLKQNPRRPFLLWLHLYDPHFPYTPPEPYATRYRAHPYDGEIAFADSQVGRLFSALKQQKLFDGALIVLAADHGEGLGEHGEKTHGFFIYDSTLHVPLIVKLPGMSPGAGPRVVADEVSLVDIMPTVLQALRIPVPPGVQGRSLLGLVEGRPAGSGAKPSDLYAETYLPLIHFGWSRLRGLEWHGWKYIDAPRPELYDTRADPHELKNLLVERQSQAHEMHDRLSGVIRRFTPAAGDTAAGKEPTDPALLERLRSLGYVAVSAGSFVESSGKPVADPKDRVRVYELFSEAMSDGQHGRYEESLAKLREAEKAEPALLPIRYLMALDYYRQKDFPMARDRFQAALELDPKFALATYYLGLTEVALGDLDDAGASFRRALELDPTNFSAAFDLGALELKRNHAEAALGQFQHAVDINPDYAQAWEALGEVDLYLKRNDDAVRALERAVRLAPDMAKAHLNLSRAYQEVGRAADAQRESVGAQSK